jgi:hypothetical protein
MGTDVMCVKARQLTGAVSAASLSRASARPPLPPNAVMSY